MLLFKRGTRKVIPKIVIPGINAEYISHNSSARMTTFGKNSGKQWRARAVTRFPALSSFGGNFVTTAPSPLPKSSYPTRVRGIMYLFNMQVVHVDDR